MNFDIPRSEIEHIIDEWCFDHRHREILKLRYLDGLTHEEIAEIENMSARQIQRIIKKQGPKVLRHIPIEES